MLFSLFDNAAHVFGPLIAFESRELAIRNFVVAMLSNQKSAVRDFPDDFILYELGEFDNATGAILPNPAPVIVMTGFQALEASKNYLKRRREREKDIISDDLKGGNLNVDITQESDTDFSFKDVVTVN